MLTALLMLFGMSAYAQNAFPEGDVNHDGKVDNADIEEVVKIIVGTSTLENPEDVGDVSGDGHVNVVDIVKIVNIMNTPAPVNGNPVITFGVKIINNTGSDVKLDGELRFVLGNPDHNGYSLGWNGSYNTTDRIRFSESAVTIPKDANMTFNGLTWKDEDTQMGMGEKSPADADQLVAAGRPKNVLVYVNDNSETVMCENMSTDIVFQEGGVYDIILSSAGSATDPSVGNPVISIGVNIHNNTGQAVTLDGDLYFVLGNPDHNGNYMGWQGAYNKTGHIRFSGSSETFGVGETKSFSGLTWNGKPVWLSTENQMDWKSAYDRALQTDGANLPVKFKLGEDTDGRPVYHTFTSINAFGDFTTAWQQWNFRQKIMALSIQPGL